jgi:hypothetical protein
MYGDFPALSKKSLARHSEDDACEHESRGQPAVRGRGEDDSETAGTPKKR